MTTRGSASSADSGTDSLFSDAQSSPQNITTPVSPHLLFQGPEQDTAPEIMGQIEQITPADELEPITQPQTRGRSLSDSRPAASRHTTSRRSPDTSPSARDAAVRPSDQTRLASRLGHSSRRSPDTSPSASKAAVRANSQASRPSRLRFDHPSGGANSTPPPSPLPGTTLSPPTTRRHHRDSRGEPSDRSSGEHDHRSSDSAGSNEAALPLRSHIKSRRPPATDPIQDTINNRILDRFERMDQDRLEQDARQQSISTQQQTIALQQLAMTAQQDAMAAQLTQLVQRNNQQWELISRQADLFTLNMTIMQDKFQSIEQGHRPTHPAIAAPTLSTPPDIHATLSTEPPPKVTQSIHGHTAALNIASANTVIVTSPVVTPPLPHSPPANQSTPPQPSLPADPFLISLHSALSAAAAPPPPPPPPPPRDDRHLPASLSSTAGAHGPSQNAVLQRKELQNQASVPTPLTLSTSRPTAFDSEYTTRHLVLPPSAPPTLTFPAPPKPNSGSSNAGRSRHNPVDICGDSDSDSGYKESKYASSDLSSHDYDSDCSLATEVDFDVNDPDIRGSCPRRSKSKIPQPADDDTSLEYMSPEHRAIIETTTNDAGDSLEYPREDRVADLVAMILSRSEYAYCVADNLPPPLPKPRTDALTRYSQKIPLGSLYPPAILRMMYTPFFESWLEVRPSAISGAGHGVGVRYVRADNSKKTIDDLPPISLLYFGILSNRNTNPQYSVQLRKELYIVPDMEDRHITSYINSNVFVNAPHDQLTNMRLMDTHCGEIRSDKAVSRGSELYFGYGRNYNWLPSYAILTEKLLTAILNLTPTRIRFQKLYRLTEWDPDIIRAILRLVETHAEHNPPFSDTLANQPLKKAKNCVMNLIRQYEPTWTPSVDQFMLLWSAVRAKYKVPKEAEIRNETWPHCFLHNHRFRAHFTHGLAGHPNYAKYSMDDFVKVFTVTLGNNRLHDMWAIPSAPSYMRSPHLAFLIANHAVNHPNYHSRLSISKDFSRAWLREDFPEYKLTPSDSQHDPTEDAGHNPPTRPKNASNSRVSPLTLKGAAKTTHNSSGGEDIRDSSSGSSSSTTIRGPVIGAIAKSTVGDIHIPTYRSDLERYLNQQLDTAMRTGDQPTVNTLIGHLTKLDTEWKAAHPTAPPLIYSTIDIPPPVIARKKVEIPFPLPIDREASHEDSDLDKDGQHRRSRSPSNSVSMLRSTPSAHTSNQSAVAMEDALDKDENYIRGIPTSYKFKPKLYDTRRKTEFTRLRNTPSAATNLTYHGPGHPYTIDDHITTWMNLAQLSNEHPFHVCNILLGPTAAVGPSLAPLFIQWETEYEGVNDAFKKTTEDDLAGCWLRLENIVIFLCRKFREVEPPAITIGRIFSLQLSAPTGKALRTLWSKMLRMYKQLGPEMQPAVNLKMSMDKAIRSTTTPGDEVSEHHFSNVYTTVLSKNTTNDLTQIAAIELAVKRIEESFNSRAQIQLLVPTPPAAAPSTRPRVHMATLDHPTDAYQHLGQAHHQQYDNPTDPRCNTAITIPATTTPAAPRPVTPTHQFTQRFNSPAYQTFKPTSRPSTPTHNNPSTLQDARTGASPNRCCFQCGCDDPGHMAHNCPWVDPNNGRPRLYLEKIATSLSRDDGMAIFESARLRGRISKLDPALIERLRDILTDKQNLHANSRSNGTTAIPTGQPPLMISHMCLTDMLLVASHGVLCEPPPRTHREPWVGDILDQARRAQQTNRALAFAKFKIRRIQKQDTIFSTTTASSAPLQAEDHQMEYQVVASMLDGGSALNLCHRDFARRINAHIECVQDVGILGVSGPTSGALTATFVMLIEGEHQAEDGTIEIRERKVLVRALILNTAADLLLGSSFTHEHNIILHPQKRVSTFFGEKADEMNVPWVPWNELEPLLRRDQERFRSNVAIIDNLTRSMHTAEALCHWIGSETEPMLTPSPSTPHTTPAVPNIVTATPTVIPTAVLNTVTAVPTVTPTVVPTATTEIQTVGPSATPAADPITDASTLPIPPPNELPEEAPAAVASTSRSAASPSESTAASPSESTAASAPAAAPATPTTTLPQPEPTESLFDSVIRNDTRFTGEEKTEHGEYICHLRQRCKQPMADLRPLHFPSHLWPFVADTQKPLIKPRWNCFNEPRLLLCIKTVEAGIKICTDTGTRKLQQYYIKAQILANIDRFCHIDPDNPPCVPKYYADIILKALAVPYACRYRPKQLVERASEDARCNWMVRIGKMETSTSAWDNPTLLVPNKENIREFLIEFGAMAMEALFDPRNEARVIRLCRLVMDFRELNLRTQLERFPLPRIIDLLATCTNRSNRYSGGDIMDAFFCVKLGKQCREYTAFSTTTKHLQYKVLPQGLHSAPAVFSRLIQQMFDHIHSPILKKYFDDLINDGKPFGEHFDMWETVYSILREHKLTLKPTKTNFNFHSQRILGHIVSEFGRTIDPERIKAVLLWERPHDQQTLHSQVGFATFALPYIENLASILAPLHALKSKDVPIDDVWEDNYHGEAFRQLKTALTSAPVILMPDPARRFRIHVDACKTGRGLGAVLLQEDPSKTLPDGTPVWGPCCYWSRILTAAERKASSVELECTAMHDCIIAWHIYLYLTLVPFEVIVDCYALVFLVCKMGKSVFSHQRLVKLCIDLQGYYFTVTHRKGAEHIDADALSRLLQIDEAPFVRDETHLRHDSGPLTAEDIHVVKQQYGPDADLLIRIINRYELDKQDALLLRVQTAQLYVSSVEWTTATPTPDDTLLYANICLASTTSDTRYRPTSRTPNSRTCSWCKDNAIDPTEHLHKSDELPQAKRSYNAKKLEQQLWKEGLPWGHKKLKVIRLQILRAIADRGICEHELYLALHLPETNTNCETGSCNCRREALLRHEIDRPFCRRVIRSLRSTTIHELQTHAQQLQLGTNARARLQEEIIRRKKIELEHFQPRLQPPTTEETKERPSAAYDDKLPRRPWIMEFADRMAKNKKAKRKYAWQCIDNQYWEQPLYTWACTGLTSETALIVNAGPITSTERANPTQNDNRVTHVISRSKQHLHQEGTDSNITPGNHALHSQPEGTDSIRRQTRLANGVTKLTEIEKERREEAANKQVYKQNKVDIELEKQVQMLGNHHYLHQQCYMHPETNQMFQVIDTIVSAARDADGKRVIRSVAWPINSTDIDDGSTSQMDRNNWDTRHIQGVSGTIELVKLFLEGSNQMWQSTMPATASEWLLLQRDDGEYNEQLDLCEDPSVRLILNKTSDNEDKQDYLHRPPLPDNKMGPLMRLFTKKIEVHHGSIRHATVRTYNQFVIPKPLRRTVLYHMHDQMGHTGSQRMLDTIRLRYWWPGMASEIKLYAHQCRFCELRKANNVRPKIPIQAYRTPLHPFHVVHIDLTGPLSNSKGFEYILLCKDALSKYTLIRKLQTKQMTCVIPSLVDIFKEYGAPRLLISDKGTEFTNTRLKDVCKLLQTKKIFCTPSNPQSNGLAENAMRSMKDMLAAYCDKKQSNWSEHLSTVQHVYNTTISTSTGYTPFYLLFGRECPSPDEDSLKGPNKITGLDDYARNLRDSLALSWDSLGGKVWDDKTKIYNRLPRKRLPFKEYTINQLAFIKRIPKRFYKDPIEELDYHLSSKLQERFSGPYRITAVLSPVLYKLMIHGTEKVMHAINMKPARVSLDVIDDQFDENLNSEVQQLNDLNDENLQKYYTA